MYENIIEKLNNIITKELKEDLIEFSKWLEYKGLSKNSISSYLNDIKQSLIFFSSHFKKQIDLDFLINIKEEEYLELIAHIATTKSLKTQERLVATWKKWADFKKTKNIKTSFSDMIYPKKQNKLIENIDFNTIFSLIETQSSPKTWQEKRNKALILLLYSSGIRINEAINLKWNDIFLEATNPYCKILGKGSKTRYVPILQEAHKAIKEYKKSLMENNIQFEDIFISPRLKKWHACSAERMFRELVKKYNLPKIKPHTLRHACATHLLKSGCNLRTIQALLGHANLETTKIYIQYSTKELMESHNNVLNNK